MSDATEIPQASGTSRAEPIREEIGRIPGDHLFDITPEVESVRTGHITDPRSERIASRESVVGGVRAADPFAPVARIDACEKPLGAILETAYRQGAQA